MIFYLSRYEILFKIKYVYFRFYLLVPLGWIRFLYLVFIQRTQSYPKNIPNYFKVYIWIKIFFESILYSYFIFLFEIHFVEINKYFIQIFLKFFFESILDFFNWQKLKIVKSYLKKKNTNVILYVISQYKYRKIK